MTRARFHPPHWRLATFLIALGSLLVACGGQGPPAAESGSDQVEITVRPSPALGFPSPEVGGEVERRIEPGQVHRYLFELEAARYFRVSVEQLGIDVEVTLRGPRGESVMQVDSPTGTRGPEILELVTSPGPSPAGTETGHPPSYQLEIGVFAESTTGGGYRLRLEALRPAGEEERQRADAARIFNAGEEKRRAGNLDAADQLYRQAMEKGRVLRQRWGGDRLGEGQSLERLGRLAARRRDPAAAMALFRQAADIFAAEGETQLYGIALHRLADAQYANESLDQAVTTYGESMAPILASGDRFSEALVLNNLGHIHFVQGRTAEALELLQAAAVKWGEFGRPVSRGQTLQNMASLHASLGNGERALDLFAEAEILFEAHGGDRDRAILHNEIGQALRNQGRLAESLRHFERSLALRRKLGDERGEAVTRTSLGETLVHLGDQRAARRHLERAGKLLEGTSNPRDEARVLELLGESFLATGELRIAQQRLLEALAEVEALDDPYVRARLLASLAETLWRRSRSEPGHETHLTEALAAAEQALAVHETLFSGARRGDLQTAYGSALEGPYELMIQILVDLHQAEPDAGHARRALAFSEHSRARSLLRLLRFSGAELAAGSNPELLARERRILANIALGERFLEPLPGGQRLSHTARQRARGRLRAHLDELAVVREELRRVSPRYASLAADGPPEISALRREILDGEAYLLEYELAAERSLLWVLGPNTLSVHPLPPERVLDTLGRELHGVLTRSHRREATARTRELLCRASRLLLAPALDELPPEAPILVVAEGALQYIPFGALPDLSPGGRSGPASGCDPGSPLLARHPLVALPSATALASLRRQRREREEEAGPGSGGSAGWSSPRGTGLAVVADAVFSRQDPRFPTETKTFRDDEPRQGLPEGWAGGDLPRLPESRREAEAILALAREARLQGSGATPVFSAFGFEARRELFTEGILAPYSTLHIATHGRLVTDFPELSGLAFSLFDAAGTSRDGFLRAPELYALQLPAELVVLSACSTALGKEARGEGLVGLTRGFFHAGAARVLVSLWDVDDAATAELMRLFYQHLLIEGRSPAEALRSAQLEVARQPGHEAPYFWAAFVLQGEWR